MTARSPSAFVASLSLHGLIVAVAILSAMVLREEVPVTTKVFEVVAGEGNNFAATVAPALGVPDGIKLNIPTASAPKAEVAPPKPEAVAPPAPPVVASPVQAVAPAKPVEQQIPDFAKNVERIADRREQRLVAKYHKQQKALQDAQDKAAALEKKRLTYEEYLKEQGKGGAASKNSNSPLKYSKLDAEGIAKGVLGGSTANKTGGAGGKALLREEQDLLGSYFAMLKLRLQEAHEKEKPAGLSDSITATAEFFVGADGMISRVSIVKSSGNRDFDDSVLAAFRSVRSVGPRPDARGDMQRVTFRMREEE